MRKGTRNACPEASGTYPDEVLPHAHLLAGTSVCTALCLMNQEASHERSISGYSFSYRALLSEQTDNGRYSGVAVFPPEFIKNLGLSRGLLTPSHNDRPIKMFFLPIKILSKELQQPRQSHVH